ncbi:hemerythrin domain-containing protein [Oceaniglobus indicus]|uniref:hemerythrin domain-containing protein n=1 Tax=Oceaniglobus indicus TaxID=2047749 RepID=UPI000C1A432C|nr:hemerythrin domain-containing protein [Oceaniglobus indicus]
MTDETTLNTRTGLPDALRELADAMPRATWQAHPNFDGLTRFWLERHLMFRDLLERLQAGNRAMLDDNVDPQTYVRQTGRFAGFLVNGLHDHHHIEDDHYFPQMKRLDPRLEHGFDILDRDHHALDGALDDLARGANGLLRRDAPARDSVGAFETQLAGFQTFLDRHLVDEEDLIVPVILRHGLG